MTMSPATSFPLTHQELTADFLTKALRKKVIDFQVDSSMTASGVLADAYRVYDIQYKDDNNKSPSSLFVKCTKAIPAVVDLCSASNTYVKEVYFYEELHKVVRPALRVPECYATFHEQNDPRCTKFCVLMEDLSDWESFGLVQNVMTVEDVPFFMTNMANFHAQVWDFPVYNDKPGLGPFQPHWNMMNEAFWDDGGSNSWEMVLPKWDQVYGVSLLSYVDKDVAATVNRMADIFCGPHWKDCQSFILKDLQTRPRTITHGDARGSNVFRNRKDPRVMGLIDWQMWAAGPAGNDSAIFWMNSFPAEANVMIHFESLNHIYYDRLVELKPEIADQYSFEQHLNDIRILIVYIWIEYFGFAVGSLDGYKDPTQADAKEVWRIMMVRNMQSLHHTGALATLEEYLQKVVSK